MRPATAASCCSTRRGAARDRLADEADDGAPRAALRAPRHRRRDRAATPSPWASRACRSRSASAQTVHALLAALIVHSANDAADRARARRRCRSRRRRPPPRRPRRRLHRPLPADPVARFVLLMNAEARALGLRDTAYRTPHGLDEPGAHSSARDVLTLARLDMASPIFRALARPQDGHDPRPPPADEQHAARRATRASTASRPGTPTRPAGTSRRAPTAAACGSTRSCSARPTRRSATATSRACSTGASTASSARGWCARGRRSATPGRVRVDRREGPRRRRSIPGEQVHERDRAAAPPRPPRAAPASASATSSCAARRGVIGRVALVAGSAGGGPPALVPWLRATLPRCDCRGSRPERAGSDPARVRLRPEPRSPCS